MTDMKHCPNCGCEIADEDIDFCTECGHKLSRNIIRVQNDSKGFFDNLSEKTSFSVIVFSFIIFGIFLFVGSILWSSFIANGAIDVITYIMLTIVFQCSLEEYLQDTLDARTNPMLFQTLQCIWEAFSRLFHVE